MERIKYLAKRRVPGKRRRDGSAAADTLGVRSQVDGLPVGIADVRLQTMAHGVPQDQLSGVITGGSDRSHCLCAAELAGEVAIVMPIAAAWVTKHIHAVDAIGGIERIGREMVINILRGAVPVLADTLGAIYSEVRSIWKQVLPVRNLGDVRSRDTLVVLSFEQIRSGEVVHAGGGIYKIQRHGKIHILQGSTTKAAHVVGLQCPSAGKLALHRCDNLRRVGGPHAVVPDVGECFPTGVWSERKSDRARRGGDSRRLERNIVQTSKTRSSRGGNPTCQRLLRTQKSSRSERRHLVRNGHSKVIE